MVKNPIIDDFIAYLINKPYHNDRQKLLPRKPFRIRYPDSR